MLHGSIMGGLVEEVVHYTRAGAKACVIFVGDPTIVTAIGCESLLHQYMGMKGIAGTYVGTKGVSSTIHIQ